MTAPAIPVPASAGARLAPAPAASRDLAEASAQFEAIFVRQMLASARQAKLAEGLFDSSASDEFRTMRDAEVADAMTRTAPLGIAQSIEAQLRGIAPAATGAGTP